MNQPCAVSLRPARADEVRAMAEMSRTLIEVGLGWRYTPARMAALMSDANTLAVVAHDGSRIQGFAVMSFGDEHAHLVLLCVQPLVRRRGVGRRLTDWLLASARVAGMASVRLELRADNAIAWAFYRQLGFTQGQLLPAYYDGLIAARSMRLELRAEA